MTKLTEIKSLVGECSGWGQVLQKVSLRPFSMP